VLRVGSLTLDRGTRRAWIGEREVELSVKEFELLTALAAEPERVHTKEELPRAVWRLGSWARTRTLDSHAFQLRQKLRAAGARDLVVNVWGVGLRLSSAPLEERMSDAYLTDLCRQIAAEHADRVVGGAAPSANGADPLALIGRLDDYAQALRDLSDQVTASEESPR
jgi:DNA-binding winged helix-turn-helix (wHTH) protein